MNQQGSDSRTETGMDESREFGCIVKIHEFAYCIYAGFSLNYTYKFFDHWPILSLV